ncbi:response regulator [Labilibaculum sp. A4]|uniref:Response regulator n=1 Tax=Labilibaculum euxinus TaxID=2686357 RepID=A0A425Y421_9BACT|nr:response regulator [Labilibaculum euxinus]MDQ1772527.1 response regulator [Labilibaculum euxinus]MUP38895.1 response regulator [Labilibaculum euxinus]MVB08100.1 response regulator [Labilibaculum euxinus]MWN78187.1 response regulator [Labilibaculum euxinus]
MNKEQNKLILVVEDEEFNRIYFEELLNQINCNVLVANNGLEAVDICIKNDKIDLVLMDIKMPLMDGYEATKKIKKIRPNLPIIAQTAFALLGDKKKSLENGCDDYIAKPVKKDILIQLIRKHLT